MTDRYYIFCLLKLSAIITIFVAYFIYSFAWLKVNKDICFIATDWWTDILSVFAHYLTSSLFAAIPISRATHLGWSWCFLFASHIRCSWACDEGEYSYDGDPRPGQPTSLPPSFCLPSSRLAINAGAFNLEI